MNTDNTQDGAERSGASAGSHVELHRAVRALLDGVNARYAKNPREWTCPHMQALDDMTQSEPQPTLTDEEPAASDAIGEIAELRFQVNKYRAKAEAYGGMVRGCNPALERAGHPVDGRGPDGAVGGIARAVEALVREREEARAEVTKLTKARDGAIGELHLRRHEVLSLQAKLEAQQPPTTPQPATVIDAQAAAANDPVREGEPAASDFGPGDGYRWVLATGPDGPGEVHEKEDECLYPVGKWRRVRHVIGRVCDEPCTYRRRITPAESALDAAAMRILDEATDIDDLVRRIRELAPDAAGRRLVAGEPMTVAEMRHALGVARQEIARLTAERDAALREREEEKQKLREYEHWVMTGRSAQHDRLVAERDAANKEVNKLRLTDEEREAILLAVEHGENASSLGPLAPIWALTLRRLLERTK